MLVLRRRRHDIALKFHASGHYSHLFMSSLLLFDALSAREAIASYYYVYTADAGSR